LRFAQKSTSATGRRQTVSIENMGVSKLIMLGYRRGRDGRGRRYRGRGGSGLAKHQTLADNEGVCGLKIYSAWKEKTARAGAGEASGDSGEGGRRPPLKRAGAGGRKLRAPAILLGVFFLVTNAPDGAAYIVQYKEQFYRLYHLHHIQYPDDTMENIYWLEKALAADFCNPLYAMALIEDKTQWEKYRYLFMMHINLKLIEQYIFLGNKWNKRGAYFYNAPWKEQNLDSLNTAENCYRTALYYWNEAKGWAEKALDRRFRFINLQRAQFWEDEAFRMENGSLDYGKTLDRELGLIEGVRARFEEMDGETY
jgi:hypothetical protein